VSTTKFTIQLRRIVHKEKFIPGSLQLRQVFVSRQTYLLSNLRAHTTIAVLWHRKSGMSVKGC
jgi:hypothetical protein